MLFFPDFSRNFRESLFQKLIGTLKCVKKLLPNNNKIAVAFKSTKLSNCFNVKDKIDFEHNHDLIYQMKCPEPTCIDDYVGESATRITENKRS